MITHYSSGDIMAYATTALENDLKLYVEYLSKKSQILKPMEIKVLTIYDDHIIVQDLLAGHPKHLKYDSIWRIGIEDINA